MKTRPIVGHHPIHQYCRKHGIALKTIKVDLGFDIDSSVLNKWNKGHYMPSAPMVLKIEKLTKYEVTLDDMVTYYNRVRREGYPGSGQPFKPYSRKKAA